MKKMKRTPFISLILVLVLVLSGVGIYMLRNQTTQQITPEEAITFANENGVSYYTTKNETGGVVVSYYAPERTSLMYSKLDVKEDGKAFVYQQLVSEGATFNLNETFGIGFSKEQLEEPTQNATKGVNGYGTEELTKELGTNSYWELTKLYKIDELDEVADNEVVVSKKAADLLGLGVGDDIKVSEDITLKIVKILERNPAIEVYRHQALYDEFIDVPFLFYTDTVRQKLLKLRERLGSFDSSRAEKSEHGVVGETLLSRTPINEFRLTFANPADVEPVLEYLEGGLLYNEERKPDENKDELARLEQEYENTLKRLLSKAIKKYDGDLTYLPLANDLLYAQLPDGGGNGFSDGKICRQINDYYIKVKNTSSTEEKIISNTDFLLNVNGESLAAHQDGMFPVTLKPGEEQAIKLIFTYDLPAGSLPMTATEEERDMYRFDIQIYYIDAKTGEETEILIPTKGANQASCLSTY